MASKKYVVNGGFIFRQVRLLSHLVRNERQIHSADDSQALRTGLYLYTMTRRFKSIEELDAQTMRAFLHWMHHKSAMTQIDVASELGLSQSYVSKILGMKTVECRLPPDRYEPWISVYEQHFRVKARYDYTHLTTLLQLVEG